MAFKTLVVAATMAATAFGAAFNGPEECVAIEPSPELLEAAAEMAAAEAVARKKPTAKPSEVNVPVYIHVIASSEAKKDGYLSVRLTVATSVIHHYSKLTTVCAGFGCPLHH